MKRLILVLLFLAGCADEEEPLPTCADVGCPMVALCNRDGICVCVPPDTEPPGIECVLGEEGDQP